MLHIILIAIAAIVVLFLIIVAMQPPEFRVTRAAKINAPPEKVFLHVNDFHQWEAWSPWAKMDPACKNTYEDPPAGTGASFAWAGNKKVCKGRLTITKSKRADLIRIRLAFPETFNA